MEILLIQPMVSNHNGKVHQMARFIVYDQDVLKTIFMPVSDNETRIKLQQAINTGEYPKVTSIIIEIETFISLKFKK